MKKKLPVILLLILLIASLLLSASFLMKSKFLRDTKYDLLETHADNIDLMKAKREEIAQAEKLLQEKEAENAEKRKEYDLWIHEIEKIEGY